MYSMTFRKLNAEQEAQFRAFTRAEYEPFTNINGVWHPVCQDEAVKMNNERAVYENDPMQEMEE